VSKPAEAGSGESMYEGRYRKRMIKQARKVPVEDVRRFIHHGHLDGPPNIHRAFIRRRAGCGWHQDYGVMELSMQDDGFRIGCIEH
jgi:hypothetical protein